MSATVRKYAEYPRRWIIASSWCSRSFTRAVGRIPRRSRPRQLRSARTEEALRPRGVGKSGKRTVRSPRSNAHDSAICSVAVTRSGRSWNSARISVAGFSHPSALRRDTLDRLIGTSSRMHSSASARNASSGTRYRTGLVATAWSSARSDSRRSARISRSESCSSRCCTATNARSPNASRYGIAARRPASIRPASASAPGGEDGPRSATRPSACAQICSGVSEGSPRSPVMCASVTSRHRFAYPAASRASRTTLASAGLRPDRGSGSVPGSRTVSDAPRIGRTPSRSHASTNRAVP